MKKFKVGETIVPKPFQQGFEKATVTKIDNQFYHVKIMCGIATIPIHTAENNYELISPKKKNNKNKVSKS